MVEIVKDSNPVDKTKLDPQKVRAPDHPRGPPNPIFRETQKYYFLGTLKSYFSGKLESLSLSGTHKSFSLGDSQTSRLRGLWEPQI